MCVRLLLPSLNLQSKVNRISSESLKAGLGRDNAAGDGSFHVTTRARSRGARDDRPRKSHL